MLPAPQIASRRKPNIWVRWLDGERHARSERRSDAVTNTSSCGDERDGRSRRLSVERKCTAAPRSGRGAAPLLTLSVLAPLEHVQSTATRGDTPLQAIRRFGSRHVTTTLLSCARPSRGRRDEVPSPDPMFATTGRADIRPLRRRVRRTLRRVFRTHGSVATSDHAPLRHASARCVLIARRW